jgi:hypothetical protein
LESDVEDDVAEQAEIVETPKARRGTKKSPNQKKSSRTPQKREKDRVSKRRSNEGLKAKGLIRKRTGYKDLVLKGLKRQYETILRRVRVNEERVASAILQQEQANEEMQMALEYLEHDEPLLKKLKKEVELHKELRE